MSVFRNFGFIILAVIVNIAPVFGVLEFGWSAVVLLNLFLLDCLFLGIRTILKIGIGASASDTWSGKLMIPGFFTIHYGLFCLFTFVILLSDYELFRPFSFYREAWPYLLLLIVSWGTDLVHFSMNKERLMGDPGKMMWSPYKKVITVLLVSAFGGEATAGLFNSEKGAILPLFVFCIVKMIAEIWELAAGKNEAKEKK